MTVTILRTGPATTIQDHGRPGLLHLGVPPSGAVDRAALDRANGLVGNRAGAAALEVTLTGVVLRADRALTVAVTGARSTVRAGDRAAAMDAAIELEAGDVLELGPARDGLRAYVAVRGGIRATAVLGSRSTDVLTGLGPAPVRAGDVLALGAPAGPPAAMADPGASPAAEPELRLIAGPRLDWLTADAQAALFARPFVVTPDGNRVGVRLAGPTLAWARDEELASEPMVAGSLQVPPAGAPILLLNDHPTVGGYPVVGVLVAADLAVAGQVRPGRSVRFRRVAA